MKRNRFKPFEIKVNTPSDVFLNHRCEISKAIINGVDFGVRNNKEKVDFAKVFVKDAIIITLAVDSDEFMELLDENIKTLVEYEEYEVCAQAMKIKSKLKRKNEKVTKEAGLVV
jgi:hypothetical protein